MSEFDGYTAWVTGAASGIGRAIALGLAAQGASIGALDVDAAGAQATAADVGGIGVGCDVADRGLVDAAAQELEQELGRPMCSSTRRASATPQWSPSTTRRRGAGSSTST